MQVSLKVDTSAAMASLNRRLSSIPRVIADALTQTAQVAQQNQVKEMHDVFDRPTPWTLGGVGVKASTPSNLAAQVFLKEEAAKGTPAAKYLVPEIAGGRRNLKGFESYLRAKGILPEGMYVVPGAGAEIDAYGNMSARQISQILSYFEATGGGVIQAMSKNRRTRLHRMFRYFAVNDRSIRLHPGIWQAAALGATKVSGVRETIRPVMLFVTHAMYQAIYNFEYVTELTVKKEFDRLFQDRMKYQG